MTGPSNAISTAGGITQSQLGAAGTAGTESASSLQQMQNLIKPYISQQTALAGGSRSAATSAAMPVISQLSGATNPTLAAIKNSLPPGAAQDKAVADFLSKQSSTIAGTEAGMVQQAPQNLAGMGTTIGGMGLQELGAQLAGLQGGAQTNLGAGQMEAAQQQALLQFFGQLAGAGGMATAASLYKPNSDRRLKRNIKPLKNVLKRLRDIPAVTFDYIDGAANQIGVIAQDVLEEFPQAVGKRPDGMYTVDYGMLAAVALQAVRELAEQVEDQRKMIAEMEQALSVSA